MTTRPHQALALLLGVVACTTACGGGGHPRPSDGTGLPSPASVTSTPPDQAVGPPTSLPWWSDGRLHVDGRTIRTSLHTLVSRGGTTAIGRTDQHGSTWRLVRGSRLVPLIRTRQQYVDPVVSANGRHLAWVESRTAQRFDRYTTEVVFTVSAYDVAQGRQVGTTSVESRVTCCDAGGVYEVGGVDNNGTVLVDRLYDRLVAWRPGRATVSATGALAARSATGNDQWPGGVSWSTTGDSSGPAAFGSIDAAGVTTRIGRVPQGQGGTWSPDGRSYAYEPFDKAAEESPGDAPPVVWTAGRRIRLQVHHPGPVVGWEDRHTVIVLSTIPGPRLVRRTATLLRCDMRTGRCEQAGPVLHHVVLPANGP